MTTNIPNEDERFDLLVDGELNEAERRELLTGLDAQPDGWRRCALAFLEAQTWRGLMGEVARPAMPATPAPLANRPRRSGWHWPLTRLGTGLAMAASFMIAVLLTSMIKDGLGPSAAPRGGRVGRDFMAQSTELPLPQRATPPLERPRAPGESSTPWQMVTLSVPDDAPGGAANIHLPCRVGDKTDVDGLRQMPSSMPPDVRRALERGGFEVRQHRQLLPIDMRDGRRLVVPVDQVEVRYVGDQAY
jgi:hypothetical protein